MANGKEEPTFGIPHSDGVPYMRVPICYRYQSQFPKPSLPMTNWCSPGRSGLVSSCTSPVPLPSSSINTLSSPSIDFIWRKVMPASSRARLRIPCTSLERSCDIQQFYNYVAKCVKWREKFLRGLCQRRQSPSSRFPLSPQRPLESTGTTLRGHACLHTCHEAPSLPMYSR